MKKKRMMSLTFTENETDVGGVKVKFDFTPDFGGVCAHQGLKQVVMAMMELANNEFKTPGKDAK